MQPRCWWFVALTVVAGACTTDTSSTTTVPSASTVSTLATTTTLPRATTTVAPQTTTLVLPDEPQVSGGWSLQAGDFLVSNDLGVAVVRDGVVVSQPVTSPVESAFTDGSGAILFVTPDPDLFPRHWPERWRGGGYSIWRVLPDATLNRLLRTDFTIDGPVGAITLFQAPIVGLVAEDSPTPIFTARSPGAWLERVHLAPAGDFNAVGGGIPVMLEGGITGIGWQESTGRLIVSVATDGGSWLEAWDFNDPIPVDWPSEWPTNPVPPDTPCPDDESFNHCLDQVTTMPGTTLIAYTETDASKTLTNLIVYDTETGIELRRMLVAEDPTFVKQLHASDTQVIVSLMAYRDLRYQYAPTIIIDTATGAIQTLPVGGVTSIVP